MPTLREGPVRRVLMKPTDRPMDRPIDTLVNRHCVRDATPERASFERCANRLS